VRPGWLSATSTRWQNVTFRMAIVGSAASSNEAADADPLAACLPVVESDSIAVVRARQSMPAPKGDGFPVARHESPRRRQSLP